MPWKEVTVVEERLKFVLRTFKSNENFTEQCRRFGISTKTGYKWLKRFEEGGVAGLKDRPTIAKEVRNKTDDKTQRRIIRLKKRYKSWGAKKYTRCISENTPANMSRAEAPLRKYANGKDSRERYGAGRYAPT